MSHNLLLGTKSAILIMNAELLSSGEYRNFTPRHEVKILLSALLAGTSLR